MEDASLASIYRRCLIAIASLLLTQAVAAADDADEWRVVVNFPMVWLPDIQGEVDVDGDRIDVDVPIGDILDNLDAGFIGELYVERGNWGLEWRSMFLATESSSTSSRVGLPGRPPLVGRHRVTVSGELFTSDLLGSYRVNDAFRLLLGVRRTGTKIDLRAKPLEDGLIPIEGKISIADEELLDSILGLEYRHRFNDRWSAVAQLDTSFAGDNDHNRQFNGFFSYRFNSGNSLWFGYRVLSIEDSFRSEGSQIKTEFTQHGPTLGWAFSF